MKYISLFSGIGGFELAIQNVFPKAECIGFSEVDKFALQVYNHHFPGHPYLGDITLITEENVAELLKENQGCDLLVGGFPCQNLSSLARQNITCNSEGLKGPKSGLFWDMVKIIRWIQKYNPTNKVLHLIIENNASMKKEYKTQITKELQCLNNIPVHCTLLNGADFGVQRRRRLYWTTFPVTTEGMDCTQTWDDVLLEVEEVNDLIISDAYCNYCNKIVKTDLKIKTKICAQTSQGFSFQILNDTGKSRWQYYPSYSDTSYNKCSPINTTKNIQSLVLDRRNCAPDVFHPRVFHPVEIERLFFFTDGWVSTICSRTRCQKLLGNTVIVKVIEFILNHFN